MTAVLPVPSKALSTTTAPGTATVTTTHGQLTRALDIMKATMPSRPVLPILGGAQLISTEAGTYLQAFDYGTSVRVRIGDVSPIAPQILPRVPLQTIVGSLVKGSTKAKMTEVPVTITGNDANTSSATVAGDGYEFSVATLDRDDYPTLPATDAAPTFYINGEELHAAVQRVMVSASADDTLPALTGIHLEVGASDLTLVTTDRFRLTVQEVPISPVTKLVPFALVPAKAMHAVTKFLPDETVTVAIEANMVTIATLDAGLIVTIRTLDGEFPKYRSLLPIKAPTVRTVNRKAFITAVERVSSVLDRGHHLRLNWNTDHVTLSAGGDEVRAKSPEIMTAGEGPDVLIAFNPAYLLEALKLFTTDTVSVGLLSPARPMVLAETEDDLTSTGTFRHLLMPARLPG
jgi:DNA polymerase-3 subunit beta